MASSYTDLQVYRKCPRLFGFTRLGYRNPKVNEPMTTGQLVHAGLTSYFKGINSDEDMEHIIRLGYGDAMRLKGKDRFEYEQSLEAADKRARDMLRRYIPNWAKDYKATLIEPELELDGVVCHPDLLAIYQDKRVIVDFKTSYHPDDRWYDISNQADLYAYVLSKSLAHFWVPPGGKNDIELIIYDIISEEGIYRHMRPPRLQAGADLFAWIQALNERVEANDEWFIDEPHPDYTCPSRCDFFTPCWLLDTDGWEAAQGFLTENFIKEEK